MPAPEAKAGSDTPGPNAGPDAPDPKLTLLGQHSAAKDEMTSGKYDKPANNELEAMASKVPDSGQEAARLATLASKG